ERLSDWPVPLEILVQVGIVARQHDRACAPAGKARVHRSELRGEGMLTTGEYGDARHDLRGIAGDKPDTTSCLERCEHLCIGRIDRAIEHRAGVIGVVLELVSLQPDARARKEVRAVEMIPVDV